MKNLNNKKVLETINKFVITQYIKNLKGIKTKKIKLFNVFPHTGAPNISEPVTITIFENLEKLLSKKYNLNNN